VAVGVLDRGRHDRSAVQEPDALRCTDVVLPDLVADPWLAVSGQLGLEDEWDHKPGRVTLVGRDPVLWSR
jgi:hypothetical protein